MSISEKLHSLEFTLQLGCKLNCKFCPQETLIRNFKLKGNGITRLSYENFKKCLEKVEKGATVTFSGMAEPFHNRECAKMLKHAYKKGYKIILATTLVDMTLEDFEIIKDIEFDHFILHIPDEEGNSKFLITPEYLEVFKKVVNSIDVEYYSCHGTVHHAVANLIKKDKYAGLDPINRAGNLKSEEYQTYSPKGKITCIVGTDKEKGKWAPSMLPDGTLVLCCMDYGMKHILGNLINQSWAEIQAGEEYKKYIAGLEDDTIDILCRQCNGACEEKNLDSTKLKRALEELKSNPNQTSFQSLGGKIEEDAINIMKKIISARNICVFGLGKLFRDKYFVLSWNKGICANIFSDNNNEIWNKETNGIKCIPPNELTEYKDLLIITHMKNDSEVSKQLDDMGLYNHINIYDIYRIFY
ncbi:radical SAM/SPASM domain-containing protein [Clostridium beijerinckii]|uniref:radical SAM/SPASM domain-containing protein n=1 Tax=Clostridium beijerinckii TaxID=1520 RepID=UPI00047A994C|nr:radical SAM/SPASM domain-containing protein [Clostridium beijerinckii]